MTGFHLQQRVSCSLVGLHSAESRIRCIWSRLPARCTAEATYVSTAPFKTMMYSSYGGQVDAIYFYSGKYIHACESESQGHKDT